ncbi:MAG: hypothetical protein AAF577_02625 [Pseudomonadota bacterium]
MCARLYEFRDEVSRLVKDLDEKQSDSEILEVLQELSLTTFLVAATAPKLAAGFKDPELLATLMGICANHGNQHAAVTLLKAYLAVEEDPKVYRGTVETVLPFFAAHKESTVEALKHDPIMRNVMKRDPHFCRRMAKQERELSEALTRSSG